MAGRPYGKPPYPMIEVFKKSSVYRLVVSKSNKKTIKIDSKATNSYHIFLKNFQFSGGNVSETSVEDVYAKYLDMQNEIYQCIFEGDLRCVIGYKRMGFDLDSYPKNKEPILISSIRANQSKIINFLLKKGVNTNISNNDGITALMIAVIKNDFSLVKLLIKHKSNPDKKDDNGFLALDLAKVKQFKKITNYLEPLTTVSGAYIENTRSKNKGNENYCWSIGDDDLKYLCLASVKRNENTGCWDIGNDDFKHLCLGLARIDENICWSIGNNDLKNLCISSVKKDENSGCWSIRNDNLKNLCLGLARSNKNDCWNIGNDNLKHLCLAQP
jgi:hypothetical protein